MSLLSATANLRHNGRRPGRMASAASYRSNERQFGRAGGPSLMLRTSSLLPHDGRRKGSFGRKLPKQRTAVWAGRRPFADAQDKLAPAPRRPAERELRQEATEATKATRRGRDRNVAPTGAATAGGHGRTRPTPDGDGSRQKCSRRLGQVTTHSPHLRQSGRGRVVSSRRWPTRVRFMGQACSQARHSTQPSSILRGARLPPRVS